MYVAKSKHNSWPCVDGEKGGSCWKVRFRNLDIECIGSYLVGILFFVNYNSQLVSIVWSMKGICSHISGMTVLNGHTSPETRGQ